MASWRADAEEVRQTDCPDGQITDSALPDAGQPMSDKLEVLVRTIRRDGEPWAVDACQNDNAG